MDPIAQNVQGVRQLVGSKVNKISDGAVNQQEGVTGLYEDELTLKLDDTELLRLEKQWVLEYAPYEAKIRPKQNKNKAFYLGQQKEGTPYAMTDGEPISSNLLFEAEETFLPAALSKNPEPVVWSDSTPEGDKIAKSVKAMLQYHADTMVLRRKLTLMVRNWSVDYLGIIKHGWDAKISDIKSEVRHAQNFIFDPKGYVDSYGDFVGYLGERIPLSAYRLIEIFPEHEAYITVMCEGKLGTEVTYTEWWTDEYTFSTFKGKILDKSKNPHFNHDKIEQETAIDGQIIDVETKGKNHFAFAKKPYTFLSVFSFGDQPHDVTGLIEQNIPNQRRVTRRTEQIDYNLSRQNNSTFFSGDNFNQETAKQAATAKAKGNPVIVPSGRPLPEAVLELPGKGVEASFFNELENSKNDLRSIFGTQGITAQQQDEDQTARGMILNQQYDNTRIGGGIGDALEQVADNIFNWWVQLYSVYYDEQHTAVIMGQMKAVEYITLSNIDLDRRVVISVAPNSMKPKDETTEMNQAMALWDKGALDPKTLFTILDFPDPQVTAGQVVLWTTNPQLYMQLNFPDLAQKIQQSMMPPGAMGPQPVGGGVPPEQITEPPPSEGITATPASAALSNVPLTTPALPQ